MGVGEYIDDSTRLYVADSFADLEDLPYPDHAVALMAEGSSRAFLIEKEFSHQPSPAEIRDAYHELGMALYKEMPKYGIYTKEIQIDRSDLDVALPEDIANLFAVKKKPFRLCSLLWLWSSELS